MTNSEFRTQVLRSFMLGSCLEPIAEKSGCTTRRVDSSPGTKLEYFIVSAANSVSPILTLIDEIILHGRQPSGVFKAGYLAQLASPKNRGGGKVNYGQILMLLPIVVAQCLLQLDGFKNYGLDTLFDRVKKAMNETTTEDVLWLQRLVDLSTALSVSHNQRIGKIRQQLRPQFTGNSISDAIHTEQFAHTMMATELRDGYPVCQRVYKELLCASGIGLIRKSEQVFEKFLPELVRPDITADCISVAFYLAVFFHETEILFP